jgi:sugar phosphate isomerase/epimerase
MISYALSTGAFGLYVTEAVASAIRKSKFRNYETHIVLCANEDEESRSSVQRTRDLIKEGVLRTASVHLPYNGDLYWDPSVADETIRRDVSARLIRLIRENADLMAPMVTLHASYGGIPQEEHPYRLDQTCKTIEELIPTARELGFLINVEYLPRQCIGNSEAELQQFLSRFDAEDVGICLDVNHIMDRYRELPAMIRRLAGRIKTFHICDYDGVDEMHWFPGQGIIPWDKVMEAIHEIEHDVVLISETMFQLGTKVSHVADPFFGLRQTERAFWFLENCAELMKSEKEFKFR